MKQHVEKPLPTITDQNREFWEGARAHELRLQHCNRCHHIRYPISEICPQCLSSDSSWRAISGKGTVFSFITFHQIYHPAYEDDVPYNVSIIQLVEGPRLISNVIDTPAKDVTVGLSVEVCFDDVSMEITIPRFRPIKKVNDDIK